MGSIVRPPKERWREGASAEFKLRKTTRIERDKLYGALRAARMLQAQIQERIGDFPTAG